MSELKYWLGFNLVKGIGPAKVQALVDHFGGLAAAWNAPVYELQKVGLDARAIESVLVARKELDLDRQLARCEAAGVQLLAWDGAGYPRYLREIPNAPPLLYVRGEILESDQWAVAVVGTRRLSAYGQQVTQRLVRGLAGAGITIISGLARGIDTIAHRTALEAGGRTIAVLGSGLDSIYPPENRGLAREIVTQERGAIVSDYPLGTEPDGKNFPPRNRLISGLSLGVVIVEAGEKSGALITANFAAEQNREVFAVPGNINSPSSRGTNSLIQQGAKLVTSVDDILEELNLQMVQEQVAVQMALPETAEEALLLAQLSHEPRHVDDLGRAVGLPSAAVSSTLTLMELKGMVQQVGGMNYVLGREPGPTYEAGQLS
jgi:DNA processing protein